MSQTFHSPLRVGYQLSFTGTLRGGHSATDTQGNICMRCYHRIEQVHNKLQSPTAGKKQLVLASEMDNKYFCSRSMDVTPRIFTMNGKETQDSWPVSVH